jgi:quinol-cytochrome oxidoreductase complex cytochrome b subunit
LLYGAIMGFTLVALGMNFIGISPIKALVWAGVIQSFPLVRPHLAWWLAGSCNQNFQTAIT